MGLPPRGRGDPFPLPLPGAVAGLQGFSCRRDRRPSSLELRVAESVNSLNQLSGYARAESAHWAHRRREATSSQASAISRIRRRIEAYGPCPRDISPRSAFEEIVKTRDLYSMQTRNIVPFCEEKVSVLRGRVTPQPLLPLLLDFSREFALNHDLMAYNEQELDSLYQQELIPRIRPYWDPILKFSRTRRVSFIQKPEACAGWARRLPTWDQSPRRNVLRREEERVPETHHRWARGQQPSPETPALLAGLLCGGRRLRPLSPAPRHGGPHAAGR